MKFTLMFNTFLLYCAASYSPYAFRDIRKYTYPHDEFKLITYAEYLQKKEQEIMKHGTQLKTIDDLHKDLKSELEISLKQIKIKQQELVQEEADIQTRRIKLNKEREAIMKKIQLSNKK